MMATTEPKRPYPAVHDESPSVVSDHAFEPRGAWWSLCRHCNLAESAHRDTTTPLFRYVSDDAPEDDE